MRRILILSHIQTVPSCPRLYEYAPNDRLYTDHLGRRIVADWEGDGQLEAEIEGGEAWLESEDGRSKLESGHHFFRGFGLVVADTQAKTKIKAGAPLHSPKLIKLLDSFNIGDLAELKAREWRVQNISERVLLEAVFEDGTNQQADCASHLNAAHWVLKLGAPHGGLLLRKTYDRFHGRQRARVLVDGEFAGMWYEPVEDRIHRWGFGDFIIPFEFIHGKESVMITIDPPSGTPLWSVSRMEMWSI